jgi:hypothetical protein
MATSFSNHTGEDEGQGDEVDADVDQVDDVEEARHWEDVDEDEARQVGARGWKQAGNWWESPAYSHLRTGPHPTQH